jgi:hypothetical protein
MKVQEMVKLLLEMPPDAETDSEIGESDYFPVTGVTMRPEVGRVCIQASGDTPPLGPGGMAPPKPE